MWSCGDQIFRQAAAFLRGFRALYLVSHKLIIMGWVNLAMTDPDAHPRRRENLCDRHPDRDHGSHSLDLYAFRIVGRARDGSLPVCAEDGMVIALAIFAVEAVGGMSGLKKAHTHRSGAECGNWRHGFCDVVYSRSEFGLDADDHVLRLQCRNWWRPGILGRAGGGGFIAQRIFRRKTKALHPGDHWFNVAHYALRPWPWILVALVAMVEFQNDPPLPQIPSRATCESLMLHLPVSLRA